MPAIVDKATIKTLTTHYIDAFVESHGREIMDVIKPSGGSRRGVLREAHCVCQCHEPMTIAQEIFDPVLSVIAYGCEDEAIRIAHDPKLFQVWSPLYCLGD